MGHGQAESVGRKCPHIVFLFSDTGGGHRSAAQAIIEALELDYPSQTTHAMVDIFHDYAPPPLDRIPALYPPLTRKPRLLSLIFHQSDNPGFTRLFFNLVWPYIRPAVNRLIHEHPADLVVSVHPLINGPMELALDKACSKTPLVTVVTDLVTTHASWYWKRANLVIVPTDAAFERGVKLGISTNRLRNIGLPVSNQYRQPDGNLREIRGRLGWSQDLPVVLMVGGAEGMGPLESMAKAIDAARLPMSLIIVAGRNKSLQEQLENFPWQIPTKVYGFVHEMPDFMHAADVLVTKAGPGTISEAVVSGLPIIIYSRLEGPEEGNVAYVVDNGAGIWAPQPDLVVEALRQWLLHPEERDRASTACLTLARPNAAREIAHLLMEQIRISAETIAT